MGKRGGRALAVMLGLLLAAGGGCGRKKISWNEPVSPGAGEQVTFPKTLPAGRWQMTQDISGTMEMEMRGGGQQQSQRMQMHQGFTILLELAAPDAGGGQRVDVTLRRLQLSLSGEGAPALNLDTDDPASIPPQLREQTQEVCGRKVTVRLDAAGKLLGIEGLPEEDPGPQQGLGFNREALGQIFEVSRRLQPPGPVGVGALWEAELPIPLNINVPVPLQVRCKLERLEGEGDARLAHVLLLGRAAAAAESTLMLPQGPRTVPATVKEMAVSLSGVTRTSLATGLEPSSELNLDLRAAFSLSLGGMPVNMRIAFQGRVRQETVAAP